MTPAYEEMYLNDAMCAMGEMLDYAVHDCGCDGGLFFTQFLSSGVAEQFERGNPKFVGGMSGVELALEVFRRTNSRCGRKRIRREDAGVLGRLESRLLPVEDRDAVSRNHLPRIDREQSLLHVSAARSGHQ